MRILNEKKWNSSINDFCFVGVPRTAGNCLSRYLIDRCLDNLSSGELARLHGGLGMWRPVKTKGSGYALNSKTEATIKFTAHLPMQARSIVDPSSQKPKTQNKNVFETMITFGTVRNPWDRIVSLGEFSRQNEELRVDSQKWTDPDKKTMIKKFIRYYPVREENKKFFYEGKFPHIKNLMSQLEWFKVDNEIKVDIILEYDTLQEDVDKLAERMSLSSRGNLMSKPDSGTASQRSRTEEYYDQEGYEMVKELYKEEIKMFNFKLSGYE